MSFYLFTIWQGKIFVLSCFEHFWRNPLYFLEYFNSMIYWYWYWDGWKWTHYSLFNTLVFSSWILILLFFASLFTNEGKIDFKSPPLTVNITNALSDVNNQLIVHCRSGDDDLRVHQLPHLISYTFTFRQNSWGSILFYFKFQCSSWLHYFNIYKDSRENALRWNIVFVDCRWKRSLYVRPSHQKVWLLLCVSID